MASEVVLTFALRKLKEAEETAKRIVVKVKESEDLSEEKRKKRLGEVRDDLKDVREKVKAERKRLALARRAQRLRAKNPHHQEKLAGNVGQIGGALAIGESARGAVDALSAGDPLQASTSLFGLVGGVVGGPVGAIVGQIAAPIVQKLGEALMEQYRAELDAYASAISAQINEERFKADYTERLAKDPQFLREQSKRAFNELLAEEARNGKRVEPASKVTLLEYGF